VEKCIPQRFAECCAAGLAGLDDPTAAALQIGVQELYLGSLAASFNPFESYKHIVKNPFLYYRG
jgi:hypothetical protein